MKYKWVKRFLDLLVATVCLLLATPIFIFLMLCILVSLGGNPFFVQRRPGKNGKIFSIIKFKTMNNKTDEYGNLLSDGERLTRLGKLIRKTSMDELPQLVNVIIGQMSIVGPRPLLIQYLPFYTQKESKRHQVKPGITGLAQISGRNLLDWDKRLEKDVFYVENMSFKLDVHIILKTIQKVIKSEDVVVDSTSVMVPLDEARRGIPNR